MQCSRGLTANEIEMNEDSEASSRAITNDESLVPVHMSNYTIYLALIIAVRFSISWL